MGGDVLHLFKVEGNPDIGIGFDLIKDGAFVQNEVLEQIGFSVKAVGTADSNDEAGVVRERTYIQDLRGIPFCEW